MKGQKNKIHTTIETLSDAIDNKEERESDLALYLDGGSVIVMGEGGREVYRGSEQEALIECFALFLGIKHEAI